MSWTSVLYETQQDH